MRAARYIAKENRRTGSRHLLLCHSLDVAAIADAAFEANPALLTNLARDLGVPRTSARALLLVKKALHDNGKIGSFQTMFRGSDGTNGLGLNLSKYDDYNGQHAYLGYASLMHLLDGQLDGDPVCGQPFPESVLQSNDAEECLQILFAMTAGHHGTQPPADLTWSEHFVGHSTEADLAAVSEMVTFFSKLFSWRGALPSLRAIKRMSYVLNGLITLCDWLGSNASFEHFGSIEAVSERLGLPVNIGLEGIFECYYRDIAMPTARDVIGEYRPAKLWPIQRPEPANIEDILTRVSEPGQVLTPTEMQKTCDEAFKSDCPEGPMLVIVRDVTGSGKTESVDLIVQRLIARGDVDGVFYGLPTMATADSAFVRKKSVVDLLLKGNPSMVLSHSRRHLNKSYKLASSRDEFVSGNADAHAFFGSSAKAALHADIGVGSVDAVLAGSLRSKHSTMRLAGLYRKALSVDEVHSYDEYMVRILEGLLYHQASVGSPVILLSATLAARTITRLLNAYSAGAGWRQESFPPTDSDRAAQSTAWLTVRSASRYINTPVGGGNAQAKVPVKFTPVSDANVIANRLVEWAKNGECAVWYRNTVTEAIAAGELLAPLLEEEGLAPPILFHSRFVYADRIEVEESLTALFGKKSTANERRGRVVISTQAGEQSLDLDFDEMVTDAAPIEAIEQRRGRHRRHARSACGNPLPRHGGTSPMDERQPTEILLHTAPLENPTGNWYFSQSRAAPHVYPDHALVWLSCLFLTNPESIPGRWAEVRGVDGFVPACDLGPALEAAYPADDVTRGNSDCPALRALIPKALWPSHVRGSNSDSEKQFQALMSTLSFKPGLLADWGETQGTLSSGDTVPTRLGVGWTIVLLEKTPDGLRFLRDGEDPLELSSLRTPRRLSACGEDETQTKEWIRRLPKKMRSRMEYHSAIVVERSNGGEENNTVYRGICLQRGDSENTRSVVVTYAKSLGLLAMPL